MLLPTKSMSSSAAFFQIMYQNETLFRLEEKALEFVTLPEPDVAEIKESPTAAPLVQQEPLVAAKENIPVTAAFPLLRHKILILTDEPKKQDLVTSEAIFLEN